jgi:filamentous hemagglutinin family protein
MSSVFASPQGGVITSGSGNIQSIDAQTTVVNQQSQSLSINWQSLNLAADEALQFNQPGRESVALNHILDQRPSEIFGQINANGRVFLMNPNGIVFGETARINVGALVAGSFQLDFESLNQDSSSYNLLIGDGLVENNGIIEVAEGGSVALIGNSVNNNGVINARLGKVHLLSADAATLSFDPDGLIHFSVTQEALENTLGVETAVNNSGTIQADGGYVVLETNAANNIFANVVNNDGIIQANRISNVGGVIRLEGVGGNVINSGDISAIGAGDVSGGEISLMGDRVGVFANAVIDASGNAGGGNIAIGGYRKGAGENVSEFTQVTRDTQIRADAIEHGEGGEIIVWADDTSWAMGAVSATGGALSGDGGFVEISGKQGLVLSADVDLTASNGEFGTLLLDPTDIVIHDQVDGVQADDGLLPDLSDATVGAGAFDIGELALEGLASSSNLILEATNDITINALTTDGELAFAIDGAGSIIIRADSDSSGVGSFTMNTGDTISTQGGSLDISAAGITLGTLNTDAASDGAITISSTASVDMGPATSGGAAIDVAIDTDGGGVESLTLRGSLTGGTVTLAGGADANDTLIAPDAVNSWTVTSQNTGTINGATFSDFPNLTGGSDDDTFTVSGIGSIAGLFDGGGNVTGDTVDYSAATSIVTVTLNTDVVNIESLIGGGADYTLVADNVATIWDVSSQNDGTVAGVSFTDFSNLTGGSDSDDFTLSGGSVTGTIDGGAGTDSLTANNTLNNWNILSANGGNVDGVFAFSNIENLTGGGGTDSFLLIAGSISGTIDGGAGSDSLAADDVANIWNITGNDAGNVTGVGAFISMENLNGRNNTDDFSIADGFSISGTIDGGDDNDTVDLSAQTGAVLVDLAGTSYANIEQFTGNATDGTLVGDNVVNDWVINAAFDGVDDGTVGAVTFIDFNNLTGGTDSDTFSLSAGILSGEINGGAGDDTLVGENTANTWNILTADAGNATGIGSFSSIENLTGNAGTDDFIFADASSLSGVINGSSSNDSVDFSAETGAVSVDIGSAGFLNIETFVGNNTDSTLVGDDIVNDWLINGINDGVIGTATFTDFNNLTGGTDADTFTLSGGSITGLIDGVAGADTLVGDNVANTWNITGADTGTVTGVNSFSNIENLTGDADTDDFVFDDPGTLSGLINGAAGTDSVDYSAKLGAVTVDLADTNFVNIETYIGNDTDSTLLADNIANSWSITGINDGTVGTTNFIDFNKLAGNDDTDDFIISASGSVTGSIVGGLGNDTLQGVDAGTAWNITGADVGDLTEVAAFSEIETLQGGNGDDIFTFDDGASFSGVIDGGAGTDEVDQSAEIGAVNINLASTSFVNIESFVGNNSDSTLLGTDTNNTWIVTGANSGTVNSISFSGFNNITGNAQTDQFSISGGSIAGAVDGGGGDDTLTADNVINAWDILGIDSGTVTNVGSFSQIENLTGGDAQDTFVFANSAGISGNVDGGADSDIVDMSAEVATVTIALGVSGFSNIESFIGNDVDSTLTGPNAGNSWNITGENDGTVGTIAFTNFNNINGNTSNDYFLFQDNGNITGIVDGAAGLDTVDLSLETGGVDITLGSAGLINIETYIGNNIASTITGDNVANTWVIDGENDGSIGAVSFIDFNNLVGNNNTDDFSLDSGTITGSIDGGNGTDSITADNAVNNWAITSAGAGNVTGIAAFFNIENLAGNAGTDDFIFANGGSISGSINGGAGSDLVDQSAQVGVVDITLDITGYSNIENFIGNGANTTLTGENIVNAWTISGLDSGTVGPVTFTSISNLQGGTSDDSFSISGGALSGQVDGGSGNDLILADNINNTWNITGVDVGDVNGINAFSNIETLLGNASADNYVFANGSSYSGVMNGAAGFDTVDYSSEIGAVTLLLDSGQYQNIESVIGNTSNSTLVGDNLVNAWTVTGINSGDVNGISFSGFNNLSGNTSADTFTLQSGSITGTIDGGSGSDSIQADNNTNVWDVTSQDAGSLTGVNAFQNIDNLLGGNSIDIFNINANLSGNVEGNANDDIFNVNSLISVGGSLIGGVGADILIGPSQDSSWIVSGADAGSVNGIGFTQIESITGGTADDTFNITNATTADLSGTIDGGDGNDVLAVDYSATSTRIIDFVGGAGIDSISLTGSGVNLTNSYVFGPDSDQVSITTVSSTESQDIVANGIESIADSLTADVINISGTSNDDLIVLAPGAIGGAQPVNVQVGAMPNLDFSNKTDLTISGEQGTDTVRVDGVVVLSGDIDITAEIIVQGGSGNLGADTLTINQASTIGDSSNVLATTVNTLVINGPTIDAYINETNGLSLAVDEVSGTLDITTSSGDITSAGSIIVTGSSAFAVGDGGSIILDNANNQFTGTPTFSSAGTINNISLTDNSSVDLQALSINGNLTVTTNGPITQSGSLTIQGNSFFNAGNSSISLNTPTNDFVGTVALQNSGAFNVTIADSNAIIFGQSSIGSGAFNATAGSIGQVGAIIQQAGAGATTFFVDNGDIVLNDGGNDFTGTVYLNNSSAGDITITESDALNLGSSSTNGGNLTVTVSNGVTLSGTTTSNNGDILITANTGDIKLGRLNAGTGQLTLNAVTGNVIGNNSLITDPNLSAQTLEIITGETIGTFNNPISVSVPANGTSLFIAGEGSANIIGLTGTILDGSVNVNNVSLTTLAIGQGQSTIYNEAGLFPTQTTYLTPDYSVVDGGIQLSPLVFENNANSKKEKNKKKKKKKDISQ